MSLSSHLLYSENSTDVISVTSFSDSSQFLTALSAVNGQFSQATEHPSMQAITACLRDSSSNSLRMPYRSSVFVFVSSEPSDLDFYHSLASA